MHLRCTLMALLLTGVLAAQSNRTIKVLDGSRSVVQAIYEKRDSSVLSKLFATEFILQQPDGSSLGKADAIRWLVQHPSRFEQAEMRPGYGMSEDKDTSLVRHFYKGREYKPDGSSAPYTVNLVMAWRLVKHKPRLYRLQMIKAD